MTALGTRAAGVLHRPYSSRSGASPHTIGGSTDTFRLLLGFATAKTGKRSSALDIADLDAPLIAEFLDHLEHDRHNSVRTRNWRLAAIHSLFGYAAGTTPNTQRPSDACSPSRPNATSAERSPGSPTPRSTRSSPHPTEARGPADVTTPCSSPPSRPGYGSPSSSACPTGDVTLETGAHVRCVGKGRKERATPSPRSPSPSCRGWLAEQPGQSCDPLFPTRSGRRLSPDAIERRLAGHLATARSTSPTLRDKHVTMHTLRRTAAMRSSTPAPTSPSSPSGSATNRSTPPTSTSTPTWTRKNEPSPESPRPTPLSGRYQPPDPLLAFLDGL